MLFAVVVAAAQVSVEFGVDGGVRELTVAVGTPVVVKLEGCRSCGFAWEAPDVTPARLVSERYVAGAKKGGKGVFEFVLEYQEPREAGVHFVYRRPWETAAAATADLTVHAEAAAAEAPALSGPDCAACLARQAAGENIACGCTATDAALVLAGGDADAHGCKPSVGQDWCLSTERCVMPGEPCQGGTEQCRHICKELKAGKTIGYKTSCECDIAETALVLAGGDVDAHGCKPSVGQDWCPSTERCVMPGEPCQGGTEQCRHICKELKAGKKIGYKTSCECEAPQLAGVDQRCCRTNVEGGLVCDLFPGCAPGLECITGEAAWVPGTCKTATLVV